MLASLNDKGGNARMAWLSHQPAACAARVDPERFSRSRVAPEAGKLIGSRRRETAPNPPGLVSVQPRIPFFRR